MMRQGAVPILHNEARKKMRSTKENWTQESGVTPLRKEWSRKRQRDLRHTKLSRQNQLAERFFLPLVTYVA